MKLPSPIRVVALFEAAKGALVVLAGFGLLALVHHNLQDLAEQLVAHLHLDPARHFPRIFIADAGKLGATQHWALAAFAALYGLVRGVEAYGLWHARRWAEWFAALSGSIYVPVELYELATKPSWLSFAALLINLAVVLLMLAALRRGGGRHAAPAESTATGPGQCAEPHRSRDGPAAT
jgi:uncharacterized membrane protein (DUF2068 family)